MTPTVHILQHGFALCGRNGVPATWGSDEQWVGVDDRDEATCLECIETLRHTQLVQSAPDNSGEDMFT